MEDVIPEHILGKNYVKESREAIVRHGDDYLRRASNDLKNINIIHSYMVRYGALLTTASIRKLRVKWISHENEQIKGFIVW